MHADGIKAEIKAAGVRCYLSEIGHKLHLWVTQVDFGATSQLAYNI